MDYLIIPITAFNIIAVTFFIIVLCKLSKLIKQNDICKPDYKIPWHKINDLKRIMKVGIFTIGITTIGSFIIWGFMGLLAALQLSNCFAILIMVLNFIANREIDNLKSNYFGKEEKTSDQNDDMKGEIS